MIYPTIEQLAGTEFNRYELVVGVAKGARIVTDEYVEMRNKAQKMIENHETDKQLAALTSKDATNSAVRKFNSMGTNLTEKRIKAQEIQAKNDCPHTLSHGGYRLLEKKLTDIKMTERLKVCGDDITQLEPPSPPKHHEKWKMARIKQSGAYTSDHAKEIAERIVSYFICF